MPEILTNILAAANVEPEALSLIRIYAPSELERIRQSDESKDVSAYIFSGLMNPEKPIFNEDEREKIRRTTQSLLSKRSDLISANIAPPNCPIIELNEFLTDREGDEDYQAYIRFVEKTQEFSEKRYERFLQEFRKFDKPVFTIPGFLDTKIFYRVLEEFSLDNILKKIKLEDRELRVSGYGGASLNVSFFNFFPIDLGVPFSEDNLYLNMVNKNPHIAVFYLNPRQMYSKKEKNDFINNTASYGSWSILAYINRQNPPIVIFGFPEKLKLRGDKLSLEKSSEPEIRTENGTTIIYPGSLNEEKGHFAVIGTNDCNDASAVSFFQLESDKLRETRRLERQEINEEEFLVDVKI